jgi:hypothetical protein
MIKNKSYENFPLLVPLIAVLLSIIGYILGAYVLSGFGVFLLNYLLYFGAVKIAIIMGKPAD